MSNGQDLKPAGDVPWAARVARWRIAATAFWLTLAFGAAALWWTTTQINRDGQLPKPAVACRFPGGFVQFTGMTDGLHGIGMRDRLNRGVSLQFERATYLGNAGYHGGNETAYGGFRFAALGKMYHDGDMIVSPYLAVVLPYWFLITLFGVAALFSSGILRLVSLNSGMESRRIAKVREESAGK